MFGQLHLYLTIKKQCTKEDLIQKKLWKTHKWKPMHLSRSLTFTSKCPIWYLASEVWRPFLLQFDLYCLESLLKAFHLLVVFCYIYHTDELILFIMYLKSSNCISSRTNGWIRFKSTLVISKRNWLLIFNRYNSFCIISISLVCSISYCLPFSSR